jgi:hypothetical protein
VFTCEDPCVGTGGGGGESSWLGPKELGLNLDINPSRECWLFQEYGDGSISFCLSMVSEEGLLWRLDVSRLAGPGEGVSYLHVRFDFPINETFGRARY